MIHHRSAPILLIAIALSAATSTVAAQHLILPPKCELPRSATASGKDCVTPSDAQSQGPGTPPPQTHSRPLSRLFNRLLDDEKTIWTSPSRVKREDIKWIAPFAVITAAMISTDNRAIAKLGSPKDFSEDSRDLSSLGSGFVTFGAAGSIFVVGSSYDPVSVIDPGNDGILGTTDDKALTLYNEKRTALGKDFLLLANAPDGRGSYAPTNPGNSVFENDSGVIGSLGTDPNAFLFANGRTFFDRAYIGKMTGCYNAPFGLRLGAVAKYYDGLPFGRLLFVEGLNQGPLFVRTTPRAQPGGFRTEFNMTLDIRVGRQFALQRGNLSAYLDFFNLLNLNQNTVEASLTGPLFEMRVPLAVQSPRVAGLGLQWRF